MIAGYAREIALATIAATLFVAVIGLGERLAASLSPHCVIEIDGERTPFTRGIRAGEDRATVFAAGDCGASGKATIWASDDPIDLADAQWVAGRNLPFAGLPGATMARAILPPAYVVLLFAGFSAAIFRRRISPYIRRIDWRDR